MAGSSSGAVYLSPWRRNSLSWAAENLGGCMLPLRRHRLHEGCNWHQQLCSHRSEMSKSLQAAMLQPAGM